MGNIMMGFGLRMRGVTVAVLAVLTGAPTHRLDAQLTQASARVLGMGENYTAHVRGFGAVALNPAGLAMPGNPGGSFALFPVRVVAGLVPIGLADLKDVQGELLTTAVKTEWFDRITAAGSLHGLSGTDVTFLAVQWGRFGIQASTTARAAASLSPGAAEILLFGNAGRTGEPGDFSLAGSSIEGMVISTAGISYAHPLIRGTDSGLALGVTVKQSMGHALLSGRDAGSQLQSDPLAVRVDFPIVQSETPESLFEVDKGAGVSVDLGAAWQAGPLGAGVSIRNIVNGFAWDEDKLQYRAGRVDADAENTTTDVDTLPFSSAPQAVQDRLDELGFAPILSAGLSYRAHDKLLIAGDVRRRLNESILSGPEMHFGVGMEVTPVGWLPLRAGGAIITGGHLLSAGAGLQLGAVRLALSAAQTTDDFGDATMVMFTLSGGEF